MIDPIYKGMRLAREDRTKNRMPSLEWIENQKLLKKLRKIHGVLQSDNTLGFVRIKIFIGLKLAN